MSGRYTPKKGADTPVPEGYGDEPRIAIKAKPEHLYKGGIETRNCRNGHTFNVRYLHPGVTPFVKACPKCFDASVPDNETNGHGFPIEHEWYRPNQTEFRRLDPETRWHVLQGGLLFRTITGVS